MKCPNCKSENLRRSRYRPEDGLWRSIFFTSYRCRDCGRRFQRLTSALLLGFVTATVLSLVFFGGFLFGGGRNARAPAVEPVAAATPAPETFAPVASNPASLPAGELALAAQAEGNDPAAQFRVGLAYLNGDGVDRDPRIALAWIEKSAEQGHAEAQYALGAMHHAGRGTLQSFPLALKWFERAAQQNHADAQYSLGVMYRTGQGVAIDKSKAYIWFNLAAAQGHERAREARDNVLPALTPEQVLAAQRAAQEWRPAAAKK